MDGSALHITPPTGNGKIIHPEPYSQYGGSIATPLPLSSMAVGGGRSSDLVLAPQITPMG